MKPDDIPSLEEALGHRFQRPELLEQALTHSSHANEAEARPPAGGEETQPVADNEQLEFLGDAVLGFVTSRFLFQRYPQFAEGELSKLRAHLVSASHLVRVANQLELGRFLRLGRGEERSGGRSKSALLVNALEAVLAALYLDAGLEGASRFIVERVLEPELERLDAGEAGPPVTDYKSALQEFLQASGRPQPSYVVVKEEGPEHEKTFTVEVRIHKPGGNGKPQCMARAQGSSKKKAEQWAAKQALQRLRPSEPDPAAPQG